MVFDLPIDSTIRKTVSIFTPLFDGDSHLPRRRSRGWRQQAWDDFGSAASDDASVKSGSCEMSRSISAACSADAGRTTTGSTGAAEEDADDAAEKADEPRAAAWRHMWRMK
uniref:Uncharacterized protein n=1 Tax=Oryza rufipogon TaxID=4529 RepID=A0A0E0QNX7_ORYRU